MKVKRLIILFMIIILVPAVSAGVFDSFKGGLSAGWEFVRDFRNPNWWAAITGVVVVGFIIFRVKKYVGTRRGYYGGGGYGGGGYGRGDYDEGKGLTRRALGWLWGHRREAWWLGKKPAQGLYYGGKGGIWAGKKGREWRRIRKDRKLEENQLDIIKRIDDGVGEIRNVNDVLNQEEKVLDERLYKAESFEKSLKKKRKEIEPFIIEIGRRIAKIKVDYENGKFMAPQSVAQSLRLLWQEYNNLRQRHFEILQRYDGLIQAEERLLLEKERRKRIEKSNLQEEVRDEQGELINLRKVATEAYDELVALKKAGADAKDIAIQKKEFKKLNEEKRLKKRELKMVEEEEAKDKRAEVLEKKLLARLIEQRRLIRDVVKAEEGTKSMDSLQQILKDMSRHSRYIRRKVKELGKIDRKNEKFERIAEILNNKKKKLGEKVRKQRKRQGGIEGKIIPFPAPGETSGRMAA